MIVIKDMKMPKNGYDCPMCRDGMCIIPGKDSDGICLSFGPYEEKRPNDCPLAEVPEPHGRLGDLTVVEAKLDYIANLDWNKWVGASDGMLAALEVVEGAPTVIPASEEAE